MNKNVSTIISLCTILLCGGCARQISSDVYKANSVGEVSTSLSGTIISARMVTVEDGEYLGDNALGIVGGGVGGALAGSCVGKGKGNTVATIGGAVLGATVGAVAEKKLKTQNAMEYIVSLDNGDTKSVVQGVDPTFAVGQNVWVIISHQGRSRVTARQ
jgi:outer membrane lipoprotein SlyB